MVMKVVLRCHSLPFGIGIACARRSPQTLLHSRTSLLPLFCTNSSTLALALDGDITYGPSLHKGRRTSIQEQGQRHQLPQSPVRIPSEDEKEEESLINKESFSRIFDVAAIRVPAEDCFALENRLRGHLLNWPRVRNIARVPGDEMDDEFKKILRGQCCNGDGDDEEERLVGLDRRIHGKADGDGESLSPVLYRDKLAKTFDSCGFMKFRNLAKISRPNRKKKRKEGEGIQGKKRIGKNEFAVVEVVEDNDEEDDMSGLLGDDFKSGRWRGSTRLLLLDERYANKGVEELPEAVKAVLKGDTTQNSSKCELVRCKLTLFYNYWQMHEILEALLPKGIIVPAAFETVGCIAHLNLRDEHLPYKKLISQVVLDKNKPKIQTVVNKVDAIQNEYRTMQLEVLSGNHSLVTTVVENGIRFNVDLATVYALSLPEEESIAKPVELMLTKYWNSRLATERQRLINFFTSKDVVCDVFSGVGPIAVSAAKKVKRVYANDLNPSAVEYLERNCVLNKLERKIEVFNMDGRRFINAMFASQKAESITQVVMNLPNDGTEYLDAFRGIFRGRPKEKETTMPIIHVYGFSKAQDPEFDFHERIRTALSEVAVIVEMHRVRLVAPGKWMLCASFSLPDSVAFSKRH